MLLILSSGNDLASTNIKQRMLELGGWEEAGQAFGSKALRRGRFVVATFADEHLYHDHPDREASEALNEDWEAVVYLSRHRSASGNRSLTVHPIGNYGAADFGGTEGTLVPSAPRLMTAALRALKRRAAALDYSVSYEVTHHGPTLATPTFFIEIGSGEKEWLEEPPAEAIARALTEADEEDDVVAVGVGGGHYAPRFTDVCLERRLSFGHMLPNYQLKGKGPDEWERMFDLAVAATPGTEAAYFHRKAMDKKAYRHLAGYAGERGVSVVRAADLEMR